MVHAKPILGLLGGIGSGKSFVAKLFAELGCLVINSDDQITAAYQRKDVKEQLRQWWGEDVFAPDGGINRPAIAARIFNNPAERVRLESLLHPIVAQMRDQAMAAVADDPAVVAFVWDTPLLVEAGLAGQCDTLVFVDAPDDERLARVRQSRGWSAEEWARREKLQAPLDKKRKLAKYMVRNAAGAEDIRSQVRDVLSRILADKAKGTLGNEPAR